MQAKGYGLDFAKLEAEYETRPVEIPLATDLHEEHCRGTPALFSRGGGLLPSTLC